jgi:hypothetical protein
MRSDPREDFDHSECPNGTRCEGTSCSGCAGPSPRQGSLPVSSRHANDRTGSDKPPAPPKPCLGYFFSTQGHYCLYRLSYRILQSLAGLPLFFDAVT